MNNCAAALVLTLAALAKGKKVLVSRGELIEIGGEFRIPDIMRRLGRAPRRGRHDEPHAPGRLPRGGRRLDGRDPEGAPVELPRRRVHGGRDDRRSSRRSRARPRVPLVFDVGSGLLDAERGFPGDEPSVHQALADGADLVTFSGDKLLGGPQAGLHRRAGRPDRHGSASTRSRARCASTSSRSRRSRRRSRCTRPAAHDEIPVHRMIHEPLDAVANRAHTLAEAIGGDLEGAHVVRLRVGRRRRLAAGPGARLLGGARRLPRPDGVRGAAAQRIARRSSAGPTTTTCCSTRARSPTTRCATLARAVLYALEGDDLDDED